MDQEALVGISEACRILRVSPTSLRQWTDEGKIKAFVTPGGHRRYLPSDLKGLMSSHQKAVGIKDLVIELEGSADLLREMARTVFSTQPWYGKLGIGEQQHLASLGRDMLDVIVRCASEPSKREEIMELAREIGSDFGLTLAGIGLPLTDAIDAFVLHRDPIMKAATHLLKRRGTFTGRFVEAIPMMPQVMDEALRSLITAHQEHNKTKVKNVRQFNQ